VFPPSQLIAFTTSPFRCETPPWIKGTMDRNADVEIVTVVGLLISLGVPYLARIKSSLDDEIPEGATYVPFTKRLPADSVAVPEQLGA
jgi:hypothetical protein